MKSSCNFWHSKTNSLDQCPWQQLAQWDEEYFPWPWNANDWVETLSNRSIFLAWHGHGFALWDLSSAPVAYLLKILVLPKSEKQGHAGALLTESEQWLADHGFTSLVLEVSCSNLKAIGLYKHFGWQELRTIRSFYRDGSDALSMQKQLAST